MIRKILSSPFRILGRIRRFILIHKYRKDFLHFGNHSFVDSPLALSGKQNISIGDNVRIAYKSWLAAVPLTGYEDCKLEIHDGCVIGHFNHIFATKRIVLEKNVLTADKVYISDNLHGFQDVNIPIMNQPIVQNGEVVVGEGSWIGENVCILGVNIGKHCVVGANSVVTHDIPDYCVAVGVPAKVIKRFNFITQQWENENIKHYGGKRSLLSYCTDAA